LGSNSCLVLPKCRFWFGNCFEWNGKASFRSFFSLNNIITNDGSDKHIFNVLCINLHSVFLQSNLEIPLHFLMFMGEDERGTNIACWMCEIPIEAQMGTVLLYML